MFSAYKQLMILKLKYFRYFILTICRHYLPVLPIYANHSSLSIRARLCKYFSNAGWWTRFHVARLTKANLIRLISEVECFSAFCLLSLIFNPRRKQRVVISVPYLCVSVCLSDEAFFTFLKLNKMYLFTNIG